MPENPGIGLAKTHSVYRSFIINHDFELWGCFDSTHVFFSLIDVAPSLLPENSLIASLEIISGPDLLVNLLNNQIAAPYFLS